MKRLLLLVLLSSCGGSTDADGDGSGAPDAAGGAGGAAGAPGCSGDAPYCLSYCGPGPAVASECLGGQWQCPEGGVREQDCPSDTCFSNPGFFCCDAAGSSSQPSCPDHGAPVCAPGLSQSAQGELCDAPAGCETSGCAAGELCVFADGQCGKSAPGSCEPQPGSCGAAQAPVCGCDGQVHPNECTAKKTGVDLGLDCLTPNGFHACGTRFCLLGSEYCEVSGATFACKPLPAACGGTPSCGCLAGEPCGGQCSDAGAGAIKLSCTPGS